MVKHSPEVMAEIDVLKIADTIMQSQSYMPTVQGEFLRLRDAYAWLVINSLGLRPKECLSLKWSDIDFKNRLVKVSPYYNKARVDFPATLTKPAIEYIEEYTNKLNDLKLNLSTEYLFPSVLTWQPMSSGNYARRFLAAAKEAGIAKISWYTESGQPKYNIRPYTGRHNFCTKIWRVTHDTTSVQKLARHKKLESSQAYIHLSNEDKMEIADEVFK